MSRVGTGDSRDSRDSGVSRISGISGDSRDNGGSGDSGDSHRQMLAMRWLAHRLLCVWFCLKNNL